MISSLILAIVGGLVVRLLSRYGGRLLDRLEPEILGIGGSAATFLFTRLRKASWVARVVRSSLLVSAIFGLIIWATGGSVRGAVYYTGFMLVVTSTTAFDRYKDVALSGGFTLIFLGVSVWNTIRTLTSDVSEFAAIFSFGVTLLCIGLFFVSLKKVPSTPVSGRAVS